MTVMFCDPLLTSVNMNKKNDYKCHQAVHELGGIPPLLELLKSDFPVIQHLALKTLQFVTTDKDAQKTFREEQGFEKLMDVLHNVVSMKCFTKVLILPHLLPFITFQPQV